MTDDVRLFEKLCFESFQSGLAGAPSWPSAKTSGAPSMVSTSPRGALRRVRGGPSAARHRHRAAPRQDRGAGARRGPRRAAAGPVRLAAVYFWRHETGRALTSQTASVTPESAALSKGLKRRGWKFIGPAAAYAFMRAMVLVNGRAAGYAMTGAPRRFRMPGRTCFFVCLSDAAKAAEGASCTFVGTYAGSTSVKQAPPSGVAATSMPPPCSSAMRRATHSPRPNPRARCSPRWPR